jgi:hypothetical protein
MNNGMLTTSVRDKMIIMAITWIATLGLIIIAIFAYASKYTEALAILASIGGITGQLGTAYKGNPSTVPPPIPITSEIIVNDSK